MMTAGAYACAGDIYDRTEELQSIKSALSTKTLPAPDKAEIAKLLDIAEVDPHHLGSRGLALQSDARGKALNRLGLVRIPAKPQRDLDAIKAKLSDQSAEGEKRSAAEKSLDRAERLWSERQYDESRQAIAEANALLGIKPQIFRC